MAQMTISQRVRDLLAVFKENEEFSTYDEVIEALIDFAEENIDDFEEED